MCASCRRTAALVVWSSASLGHFRQLHIRNAKDFCLLLCWKHLNTLVLFSLFLTRVVCQRGTPHQKLTKRLPKPLPGAGTNSCSGSGSNVAVLVRHDKDPYLLGEESSNKCEPHCQLSQCGPTVSTHYQLSHCVGGSGGSQRECMDIVHTRQRARRHVVARISRSTTQQTYPKILKSHGEDETVQTRIVQ